MANTKNNGATHAKEAVAVAAAAASPAENGAEVDDEARSEATFSFKVKNMSKLRIPALSPPCIVRNLPWRIMIMQRRKANQPVGKLFPLIQFFKSACVVSLCVFGLNMCIIFAIRKREKKNYR